MTLTTEEQLHRAKAKAKFWWTQACEQGARALAAERERDELRGRIEKLAKEWEATGAVDMAHPIGVLAYCAAALRKSAPPPAPPES